MYHFSIDRASLCRLPNYARGPCEPTSAVEVYNVSNGSWLTLNLPGGARYNLAATSVGPDAFFAGGDTLTPYSASNVNSYSAAVDVYNVDTGNWQSMSLPGGPRFDLAATTVGPLAIFAGGYGPSGYSSAVDIYNINTGVWSTGALSQARSFLTATTVGNYAIFAGGGWSGGVSNVVDVYDASTGQWSTTQLSQARYGLESTTVGDFAIFAGGYDGVGFSSVVDVFDASTGTWFQTTLQGGACYEGAATAVGSTALIGGGYGASDYNSSVDLLTLPTLEISSVSNVGKATIPPASEPIVTGATSILPQGGVTFLSATAVGDKALFAGGYTGTGYSGTVDIYNASTRQWQATSFPNGEERAHMAATTLGDYALFAGGVDGHGTATAEVDIYDVDTGTWSITQLPSGPRVDLAATSVGPYAFFAGGSINATSYSSAVDIYNVYTGTWLSMSLQGGPRYDLAATAVGTLAIFAGGYGPNGYSKDVDIYNINNGIWSTALLTQARSFLTATTVGDYAIFAGGGSSGGVSNVVDIYDYATSNWSTATLSVGRYGLAATSVGDLALFGGGYDGTGMSDVVDIFDSTTGSWSTTTLAGGASYEGAATSVGGIAIFASGYGANGYNPNVDLFAENSPTTLLQTDTGGGAQIDYTLVGTNDETNLASIQFQYSVDGGPWQQGHFASTIDGTVSADRLTVSGLTSTDTGTPYSFMWNTAQDLGDTDNPSVQLRITPTDASGDIGVTQASGLFAVDNTGEINNLVIDESTGTYSGYSDDIKLVQNGETIAFSGTLSLGGAVSASLSGSATNITSISVIGGTGDNLLDASGLALPATLNGGFLSGMDTLRGGAGDDLFDYSGAETTYEGGGGATNTIVDPSNLAAPMSLGSVSGVEDFLVAGLFWPVDGVPLLNASLDPLSTSARSPTVTLTGSFTDENYDATAGTEFAAVNWGDGTTSLVAVTAVGSDADYSLNADHIYATDGSWTVVATIIDDLGASVSVDTSFSGGLVLSAEGELASDAGTSSSTVDNEVDTSAQPPYVVNDQVATPSLFTIHTGGSLWEFAGSSQAQQISGMYAAIALGPDDGLYALNSSGGLGVVAAGASTLKLVDSGVKSIITDTVRDLYKLNDDGSLSVMPAGTSTWVSVLTNVKSISPSGDGVNVLTNAGTDWQYNGTVGELLAGPHLAFTSTSFLETVTSATWDDGVVTITTSTALPDGFAVGDSVALSGMSPTALDGTFLILAVPSDNQFTFGLPTDPGTATALGTAASTVAGDTGTVTLSVLDAFGNPVVGYTGAVTFTDSDSSAVAAGDGPPASPIFVAADNGSMAFSLTFLTSGPQTISATDNTGLSTSMTVNVNAGSAADFSVDPPPVQVGASASITVTAYDKYGNVVTNYTGAVTLSDVNGSAAAPIESTSETNGIYSFKESFSQAGGQKLVATGGGLAGDGAIVVTPGPYDITKSTLTVAPSVIPAGGQVAVTLTVRDSLGNQETSGGLMVSFALAAGSTTGGNFGATVDNGNGTYTAIFTAATVTGLDNFTAMISGTSGSPSPASLTITRATPTIIWPAPPPITYGTALGSTQLDAQASVPGAYAYSPESGFTPAAGQNQSLGVMFTPDDTSDYINAAASVSITVLQAAPIVTVQPLTLSYGTPLSNGQLVGKASWTVDGNSVNVPGTFSYTIAGGTAPDAGAAQSELVTFTPDNTTDYQAVMTTVSINVTPVPLVITAINQTKVYGATLPTFTASYAGFVNGDSAANLALAPSFTTTATPGSPVAGSPYTITAFGAIDANYTITYVPGTLTITPAPLTITARSQTKQYGAPVPPLTALYTGLVNGDMPASLSEAPTLTTVATPTSPVASGPYAISVSGAGDSNYAISYEPGTLTILPAPLTITAASVNGVAMQPLPAFSVNYSGFVLGQQPSDLAGSLTVVTPATSTSPGGLYPIIPGGLTSTNYAITYVDGILDLAPLPTVTVTGLGWETVRLTRKKTVQELFISFSGALNAGDADELAAYSLDSAKKVKKKTVYTTPVPLLSTSYNPATNRVTLMLRGKVPSQVMQLTINAALVRDAEGRELDGNGDGQPGGNFVATLNNHAVISLARTDARERSSRIVSRAIDDLMAEGQGRKWVGAKQDMVALRK